MKNNVVLTFTVIVLLIIGCFEVHLYISSKKDLTDYSFSIGSYIVAFIALVVALMTFISIDNVNNISRMDGNILENHDYSISLPELVCRYTQKSELDLQNALIDDISRKLKKESKTAADFADTLQFMIDIIILFPAVFKSKNTDVSDYHTKIHKIIDLLDSNVRRFDSLNKGSLIQIYETTKLFKSIVAYQLSISKGSINVKSDLLHVRRGILKNNVTQTIYHNYLGLYYHKRAMREMLELLDEKNVDFYSSVGINKIKKLSITESNINDALVLLENSSYHYEKAIKLSSEDIVWPGFVYFNLSRTQYLVSAIKGTDELFLRTIDMAISERVNQNRVIEDVQEPEEHDSLLNRFFLFQEEKSRLYKMKMIASVNKYYSRDIALQYRGNKMDSSKLHKLLDELHQAKVYGELEEILTSTIRDVG